MEFVELIQACYEEFYPKVEEHAPQKEREEILDKLDEGVKNLRTYWQSILDEIIK